jgi:uncharacterized membrane protein
MAIHNRGARPPMLLHPIFAGPAAALLMAALFTDYMYYSTALMQWANFSAWLIVGGLVVALFAAIFLVIDLLLGHTGPLRPVEFSGLVVAAVLSIFNAFVHSRDAWTSVVPTGITLSAIVAILLFALSFRGWSVTAERVRREGDRP